MTAHYEYDQTTSSPFATLRQLDEGPLLKEVTRGYQLDMQCTLSLEHLISQEKFQPEGLDEYEPENAREWSFRDSVRRVIKELVTVKNHYFGTLTQALTLLQKREQKISYQSALLEFHNKMNSHKDMQIEALKRIIEGLGFDPESREIPSHQRVTDLQSRMSSVTREDVIARIQQSNKLQLSNKDSKNNNRFSQPRSSSAKKRNSSTPKDSPLTLQQGSNIIRKVLNTVTNRSRENSSDQRRSSVSRKENEFSSTTQHSKQTKKPAGRKPFDNGIATSSFAQDIKKILSIRKTPKSPLKPVSASILNSQRSYRAHSKADVFENLRIESTELPRGVRLVSKTSQNVSRQTTQRSIERHNTDFPCQEKLPVSQVSQRSASLSRSPDSTPSVTVHSSRVYTVEEVNMLNKKDRTDVFALQKGLKKSCKKLMRKTGGSQGKRRDHTDPISCEDQKWNLSHQEIPVRDENPRQRRSKSIGSAPAGVYEIEDITECRIKPVVEKRNNESPVKEMSPRALIEKQIEAFKKNYDSQSSIGGSLLHDINSISYCNQMDLPIAHKDQENKSKEQGKSKPKKLPIQAFGLKDITKTLNSRGNLSARGGSGYVVHTERSPMRDEEKYDFLQRRRSSVGKRESSENGKLEVMYGTKALKKVKNWAPLLTKKC